MERIIDVNDGTSYAHPETMNIRIGRRRERRRPRSGGRLIMMMTCLLGANNSDFSCYAFTSPTPRISPATTTTHRISNNKNSGLVGPTDIRDKTRLFNALGGGSGSGSGEINGTIFEDISTQLSSTTQAEEVPPLPNGFTYDDLAEAVDNVLVDDYSHNVDYYNNDTDCYSHYYEDPEISGSIVADSSTSAASYAPEVNKWTTLMADGTNAAIRELDLHIFWF